jgi:hypothetical protein
MIKNFLAFAEPQSSLPCSQEPKNELEIEVLVMKMLYKYEATTLKFESY